MRNKSLDDLAQITDAQFRAEQSRLSDIVAEEAALRQDIARLDAHHRDNQNLPETQLSRARTIGADVLWQGWVGRTRKDLQMRLARVLVRKANMMDSLRQAYGKSIAAQTLQRDEHTARQRLLRDARSEAAQALEHLKRW